MNKLKIELLFILFIIELKIKRLIKQVKCRIWNKNILLRFYKLWIRDDESHISLSMDLKLMCVLNKKERNKYLKDLYRRRDIAHKRDM